MSIFETVQELVYGKSPSDTISDIENAFSQIGKVVWSYPESGIIQGKTKYGLNPVTIDAQVKTIDDKTIVTFRGKSSDMGAVGAQKGIENLISTMHNLGNTEYIPSKTAGVKPLWVIALCIQIALSFFIAFGIRTGNFQSGLMIFLVITWIVVMIYLVLARLRSS